MCVYVCLEMLVIFETLWQEETFVWQNEENFAHFSLFAWNKLHLRLVTCHHFGLETMKICSSSRKNFMTSFQQGSWIGNPLTSSCQNGVKGDLIIIIIMILCWFPSPSIYLMLLLNTLAPAYTSNILQWW